MNVLSPMVGNKFVDRIKKKVEKHSTGRFQVPFYLNGYSHQRVWTDPDDSKNEEFEDNTVNEV